MRPYRDPLPYLEAWLSGRWTNFEGHHVAGRLWDPDSEYRYRRYIEHWIHVSEDQFWEPTTEALREWTVSIVRYDTGEELSAPSQGRALSTILAFYDHLHTEHRLGPFRLPRRGKIMGFLPQRTTPNAYEPWVASALRTAADRYTIPTTTGRGPNLRDPQRYRLACYLTLSGLMPRQAMNLDLTHLHPDHDQHIFNANIPHPHHADPHATIETVLPWALFTAIEEFRDIRRTQLPHSGPHFGPVLTARTGQSYDRSSYPRLIRTVAATSPDLEDFAPTLRTDWLARTPNDLHHIAPPKTLANTKVSTDDNHHQDQAQPPSQEQP